MKASQDSITVEDSGRSDVPAGDSGMWDFREPADFTGKVEELSRFVEHLQVVGAGAGTPQSFCGRGCGSAPQRPAAGWSCCRGRALPVRSCLQP